MNTYFQQIYLKLNQIDLRHLRLAWLVIGLFVSGGMILGIPINGDVGG
jgi:hypothetical protein